LGLRQQSPPRQVDYTIIKTVWFQPGHLDALSELTSLPCEEPDDCHSIESSYCDFEANLCRCKPDFPVTDSKHCYKGKSWLYSSKVIKAITPEINIILTTNAN
jgi:hypothetical protein